MKGYQSTFVELFDVPEGEMPAITAIEIPIIQRDFAQGREDDDTAAIRERFLDAIVNAAMTDVADEGMGLDFIYGDVKDGVLRPLDGQQRLTTLFLLHWYVASSAAADDPDSWDAVAPWLQFSYATRPTARDFSRAIAQHPYPAGSGSPSEWITDQPWYVYPWRQDPTISSMLVMLDAIHERFDEHTDFAAVWNRLLDRENRAIWFLFLPVAEMDYGEDLYIKMNSRGKPLTSFEVFKADLEGVLGPVVGRDQHEHLKMSIDGAWADILWEYEKADGGDFMVDDEFMRYLSFIVDVCDWRDGAPERRWRDKDAGRERPLGERARLAFADPNNEHAARNREFFFHAFDTWTEANPKAEFSALFRADDAGEGPLPLLASHTPDLFGACVQNYGAEREFTLADTLLLFAVLLARQLDSPLETEDLNRRLRTLRNLCMDVVERKRMAEYVATVEDLILKPQSEALAEAQGFPVNWISDERLKWQVMDSAPEVTESLHRIEDQPVTRGCLLAFDLDPEQLDRRATAFAAVSTHELRDAFGAALLTKGDYSRDVGWEGTRRQLGNSGRDDSWRAIFTTGSREALWSTRAPLMALLDDVADRLGEGTDAGAAVLDAIREDWLDDRIQRRYFDWRYYLVRYRGARSSMSEGYYHNPGYDDERGGFSYGRIRMLNGRYYIAKFSDALLRAAWVEGDLSDVAEDPIWWHREDPGMAVTGTGVEIRCVDEGLELVLPSDDPPSWVLNAVEQFPGAQENRVLIQQQEHDGIPIDSEDRVQVCIRLTNVLYEHDG